ncbi:protein NUCLEAR FUSION DEFECTIVE 6, chloroplastic/mitochondrial-like [Selaginella moellendorffii]|uniref:protein NUCLEAR FUSION DEFECTIVE 6, chloroplastic/mitochondrial-like n=1 Tax=Selaginella moellendorffii TaxID=88036 RepID=UPI000D1C6BB2|nr:protein NUCLEAR FUSION DEFECTIVE 6, chloroplastic/mitochondrial-like [Selaginella moellendorffii]|eukprot:XP_024537681.1 protein NUCLEAR FUSION DEFECTIVE 6, chloroplastic/mitochondrial-like [Selaginella moellendorffii]
MAARTGFARRAFFNAAQRRPAAAPRPPPPLGFAAPRRGSLANRMNSPVLRREVSTMLPFHSATAKAWLVSRISDIPVDAGVFRTVLKMFQVEECSA